MKRLKKKAKSYLKETILPAIGQFVKDSVIGISRFLSRFVLQNAKVVIILFALFWFYENKVDFSRLNRYMDSAFSQFKEGEVAKVEVDCRDNTAIEHVKGQPPKLHEGVKRFRGSQFEDGRIETAFKNKGVGLEPGFVVTAGDGLRLGLDVEYAYWKRWGLLGGVTFPVQKRSIDRVRGHLGLGYDLPSRWLSHTSIYGGIDTNKTPTMGFRTKFGGGL